MPHPLFIYGTLHPDRAPAAIAPTVALLRPLGPATIRGHLLDLGAYPGLILPGDQNISGHLFALPFGREEDRVWSALDRYEGFRPAAPATSLFIRSLIEVTLPDGTEQTAWVYLFNRSLPTPR